MAHRWDPVERRLERAEEKIGQLQERLAVAQDALEFALTFYRAAFNDEDPVTVDVAWQEEIEVRLSHAISEARRR